MGQKVNPKGIRLGIVRDWDSKWYATGKDYPKYLLSDIEVRDFLFSELISASVSRIGIERLSNSSKNYYLHSSTGNCNRQKKVQI